MDSPNQPTQITCPQCGAKLRIQIPENEAVDVVCPRCQAEFPSETVIPPAQTPGQAGPASGTGPRAEPGETAQSAQGPAGASSGGIHIPGPRRAAARKKPEPEPEPQPDLEPEREEAPDFEPEQADSAEITDAETADEAEARPARKPKPDVMPVTAGEHSEHQGGQSRSGLPRALVAALMLVLLLVVGIAAYQFVPRDSDDPASPQASNDPRGPREAPPTQNAETPGAPAAPTAPDFQQTAAAALNEAAEAAAQPGIDPAIVQDQDRKAAVVTPGSPVGAVAETSPAPLDLDTVLSSKTPDRKNWQKAAALGKIFLESPSWQEMTNYVRAPEAVTPLMREYYRENPYKPRIVDSITKLQLAETQQGVPMAFLVLQTEDYALAPMTLEMVDGEFKVDWESHVGLQGMPWNEFRREKPTEPVEFRVGIASADNLGIAGMLRGDYHAFRLIRQDAPPLTAFIPKLHPDAGELFTMVQDGEANDVILALKYADGPSGEQHVEITELVQKGWVRDYGTGQAGR